VFYVNRTRLLIGLEALRRSVCPYSRPQHGCDCKYGVSLRGEQNGCPELREAIHLLAALTQDEFEELILRVDGLDVDALQAALSRHNYNWACGGAGEDCPTCNPADEDEQQ
jgi:hypothetical protein